MDYKPVSELETMSSDAIDRYSCAVQEELRTCNQSQEVVQQHILQLQEQILKLQLEKKQLEQKLSTAKYNVKQLTIQAKLAESVFWSVRNDRR